MSMGILTEDMKRLVDEQQLGFHATVCPDGSPNLSPKGSTRVWDEEQVIVVPHAGRALRREVRRAVRADGRVEPELLLVYQPLHVLGEDSHRHPASVRSQPTMIRFGRSPSRSLEAAQ